MIIYDLCCDRDHRFEAWFRNADEFDMQRQRGLLSCPQCDSQAIRRVPSAVAVSTGKAQPPAHASSTSPPASGTTPPPTGTEMRALYRQFVQVLRDTSEDVGDRFADEARKIHYQEAPERAIRGKTTRDEYEALRDEGIEIVNLPDIPEESLN